MMIDKSRSPRKVAIAGHLWEVFEQMAEEMGSDREGLVNQAMFMFARLNGYLNPAQSEPADVVHSPTHEPVKSRVSGDLDIDSLKTVGSPPEDDLSPVKGIQERPSLGPNRALSEDSSVDVGAPSIGDGTRRRRVEERVLETAAQLERQIKSRSERASDQSSILDDVIDDDRVDDDIMDDDEIVEEFMSQSKQKSLYIMTADGELDKVSKERFLIGRGKHCDFVVQSGKVSREHAVIVKESDGFYMEDLGSSNGTWFQKQRLKRRQIADGDEFFICSEKIKCVIR